MRFLTSDLVLPVSSSPLRQGVVAVEADGRIADVLPADSPHLPDASAMEHHSGILCPGFVNAHCHLELSHMQGLLPEGTGLDGFIGGVIAKREADPDAVEEAMSLADAAMWQAGIQAAGDICNTTDTLEVKQHSRIRYHSFIELLGVSPERAELVLERGRWLLGAFEGAGLSASLAPHAPYSVSAPLLRHIAKESACVSMHSQETASEDEMFVHGTGALLERLRSLGIRMDAFSPSGRSSLRTVLPMLADCARILLVHSTFTSGDEMQWANAVHSGLHWCTCPSANRYIEGRVPQVDRWLADGARVCIGTDSLASNHQLSVLEEMKLLSAHCPSITFSDLLRMGTINGAEALGMDGQLGSLEKGKRPGVLLLEGGDMSCPVLSEKVSVKRMV